LHSHDVSSTERETRAATADPVVRHLADQGLYIGITAWTEHTLVESGELYPPEVQSARDRLRFYTTRYPITEVDSTFYRPPTEQIASLWVERTPPGFLFDVKAFRLLTEHPTPPHSLWRDLRDALPSDQAAKRALYGRDLPSEFMSEALRRFGSAIKPLRRAGRLGLVLFQFPRYFYPSKASFERLEWIADELSGWRVGVEFRQGRWLDDQHRGTTLGFLRANGLAYVCADEPQGFKGSVPPIAEATADVAEVRFHGRNAELWEARDVSTSERFRYEYSTDELAQWVPGIEHLHEGGRTVHLLMNNCYGGLPVRAASHLAGLLERRFRR
jgi:uncharacterized protein YecE (DUF72 family)